MKNIISKTMIFIGIIPTAIIFKLLFGTTNMLVGITAFMAATSLIYNDYTPTPIKNTLRFISIELFIGACAFISTISPSLTLVSTFISIFFIIYIFTYDTSKPIYMPFALSYLFMVYFPAKPSDIPARIGALILSGMLIMLVQIIANKNKFWTKSKSTITKNLNLLINELEILIDGDNYDSIIKNCTQINRSLKSLSKSLYSRREKTFIISDKTRLYLCITQTIEGANIILEQALDDKENLSKCVDVLKDLKVQFEDILKLINNKKDMSELKKQLNHFIYSGDEKGYSYYISYELKQNMTLLKDILTDLENGGLSLSDKRFDISDKIKEIDVIKKRFNRNSLRFTFAFRVALVVSLGAFIVNYFDLYKGKWMVFTLASVIQPYIESSESKMLDRIKGTLIGVLIFELLFHLVPNIEFKIFIGFACGYISNYFKDYSKRMTFMTVFALSIGATSTDFNILSFDRIKFILLGCFFAFVANRTIFPYKIKVVTRNLIDKSIDLNKTIEHNLGSLCSSNLSSSNLREVVLTNNLTNEKISINNNTICCDKISNFLVNERVIMSNLRVFKNSIKNNRVKNLNIPDACKEIQQYITGDLSKSKVIDDFNKLNERDDKLIFMNIYEILKSINDAKNIANTISKV
ncbi:membrane protein [[Clostridium] sordellii]|uniref:FUSC family protein n=1 Tax=Paraclostridium sordellii TaxID=1505 RepID=UPI0005DD6249|nr:FUSC family protein [Paeniclostridium sordellii]CEN24284.1 membrane protein [[Clostridium] sordellii] [Paeniclostridium sordellii]